MSVDVEDIIIWLEKLLIDELNSSEPDVTGRKWIKEAYVDRVGPLKIYINLDEHTPPHFHVQCQNFNTSFTIEDCTKLNGDIDNSDYKKLKRWYLNNQQLLIEVWNRTRPTNCPVGEYRG